jgi:hypothetical protein
MTTIPPPGKKWRMDRKTILGARLAYDSESDRTILFGGFNVRDWFYE